MAKAIEIKYCEACGQLESMRSTVDYENQQILIDVWCSCGAEAPRRTELNIGEAYYLEVETRKEEATGHEDSDSGDVPAGGEAGRESDV